MLTVLVSLPGTFLQSNLIAGAQRVSRYEFGLKLARALRIEPKFAPALSALSPTLRPRDCTLDIARAQNILRTRLRGVDEVLAR